METIKIKDKGRSNSVGELVKALDLLKKVNVIIKSEFENSKDEEHYTSIFEADSDLGSLVNNITSAIGIITSVDISVNFFDHE